MATTLTSAFAQLYALPAAGFDAQVVDNFSHAGRTITVGAVAARYFRTFLAKASSAGTNAGTIADPDELLKSLETALNLGTGGAHWSVTMLGTGIVHIAYDVAYASSITWTDTELRSLLGFTVNVSVNASSQDAVYQPTHMVFFSHRPGEGIWQPLPPRIVGGEMPGGDVYTWRTKRRRMRCTFDLADLPKDIATRTAIGDGSMDSPIYPSDKSRWQDPEATLGTAPPWSLYEFMATSDGSRVGAALGNFRELIAGSTPLFDEMYWTLDTLNAAGALSLKIPNVDMHYVWKNLSAFWKAQGTR